MGKARMTALDLRAVARSLNEQSRQLRVANVYDISSKVYVLKLSDNNDSEKRHLLLQSGIRAHLSKWKRNKQAVPSVFTMKLRKFIRTKRITQVRQLGSDRVLDIQFGNDEHAVHLITELYARGNVVLTDHEHIVISAWRQMRGDVAHKVAVKTQYPLKHYEDNDILKLWHEDDQGRLVYRPPGAEDNQTQLCAQRAREVAVELIAAPAPSAKKKAAARSGLDVVAALVPSCHRQMVLDECSQWLKESLLTSDLVTDAQLAVEVETAVRKLLQIWRKVTNGPWVGYVYKEDEQLNNLSPYPLAVKAGVEETMFDSFHDAADCYFTTAEVERADKLEGERLNELESKVEKIRKDQFERVRALEEKAKLAEQHANAVEYHVLFITKVIEMMKRLIHSGTDWEVLRDQIKAQSRANHPVASYITDTDFAHTRVRVLIPASDWGADEDFDAQLGKLHDNHESEAVELKFDSADEEGSESSFDQSQGDNSSNMFIDVWIDYNQTAYANVMRLHEEKKQALTKFEKTQAAAEQVLKQAEHLKAKEAAKKAASAGAQQTISRTRKVFWFEKFYWFISSDGYLVIAGHDATQNEILYKKYLSKSDIYVHADVHGAASCIIRNAKPDTPVPQTTIQEAGIMSVCRSNAWKTKLLATAYWVFAHQVSKTPPPGEYVSTGGFIIRGERHPITVHKLELGICLMFCLGDTASKMRHQRVAGEESEGAMMSRNGTEESSQPQTRRESVKSNSSRVQFGSAEVAPTPVIEATVTFDPEQTEVIAIHSNRSVHSYESEPESEGSPGETGALDLDKHHAGGICAEDEHSKGTFWRPDSADELPPPQEYADRAAPGPLLRKETPETAVLCDMMKEIADNPASPIAVKHCQQYAESKRCARDKIDLVGPAPRGFLPEELPEARLLLRRRSSSCRSGGEAMGICASVPSPIQEERSVASDASPPLSPMASAQSPPAKAVAEPESARTPASLEKSFSKKISRGTTMEFANKPKPAKVSRGKLAKIKKMKEKYGDQSDDEREYAMKLLGSKKLKEEEPVAMVAEISKEEQYAVKPRHEVKDRAFGDDEEAEIEKEWEGKMSVLDELTGRPHKDDVLLFAIPMVGPLSAMTLCKFKGRLLPGGAKKGQAVSVCHRAFIELAEKDSLVRQLIKSLSADELSAVIPANPIVQMEGASKIMKADKKEKKAVKQLGKK